MHIDRRAKQKGNEPPASHAPATDVALSPSPQTATRIGQQTISPFPPERTQANGHPRAQPARRCSWGM